MIDLESSHHSRLPPYGFLSDSISLCLNSISNGQWRGLSPGVELIFLRYPLITHHLVFMAQVFITTLLIVHCKSDENSRPPKWKCPPRVGRAVKKRGKDVTGQTRGSLMDE